MPGTTPLGLRYPLPWETVTAQSFQDLSEDIDAALDALDIIETQARVPQQASVINGAGGNSVPVNVGTTLTYTIEEYDTGNLADLGVNNDRLTLSAGIWFVNGKASTSGGTTTSGTHLQLHVATVLTAFHRIDNSTIVGKDIALQALIKIPVNGTIIQLIGIWTGTGGPQTWVAQLQTWKVRAL